MNKRSGQHLEPRNAAWDMGRRFAPVLFGLVLAVLLLYLFHDSLSSNLILWGPDALGYTYVGFAHGLWGKFSGQWFSALGLGQTGSGLGVAPYNLLPLVAPDLQTETWIYIVAIAGTALAAMWFFAGRGVRGWPAALGAIALAFSAHTTSLISAGHIGKVETAPLGVLMLACLDRAICRRSLFHFALTGMCAAFAVSCQLDSAMLFVLLAGAYGVFLFVENWPRTNGALDPSAGLKAGERALPGWRYVGFNLLGALVTAVCLATAAATALQAGFAIALPGRQKDASVMGQGGSAERNKWEFATNWSLPPEEILEFVAPGIYGWHTGYDALPLANVSGPRVPYWGRTGRTLGWELHRQGLMNLRQNGHYLGVLQLVFALFAIACAIVAGGKRRVARGRGQRSEVRSQTSEFKNRELRGRSSGTEVKPQACEAPAAGLSATSGVCGLPCEALRAERGLGSNVYSRADIFFWGAVLLVCVLLALGRNFVVYRFFYMLPLASAMRAPIKFLHLGEAALCILFAYGLDLFFRGQVSEVGNRKTEDGTQKAEGKGKKSEARKGTGANLELRTGLRQGSGGQAPHPEPGTESQEPGTAQVAQRLWAPFAGICAALGLLLLLGIPIVHANAARLQSYWGFMGFGAQSPALMKGMENALVHGALLFLVAAACFVAARSFRRSPLTVPVLACGLLVVSAMDLGSVDRKYVNVWDEGIKYRSNPLIEKIQADDGTGYRCVFPVRSGVYGLWEFAFPFHDLALLTPSYLSWNDRINAFFVALSGAPLRLWQLASTREIIGPKDALKPLLDHPAFAKQAFFNVGPSPQDVVWAMPGQGQHVWLRYKGALPRALVYHAWEPLDDVAALKRVADLEWNPAASALVPENVTGATNAVPAIKARIATLEGNRVVVETDDSQPGLLVLNDRYDPGWKARVDGKPAEILQCNYVMRGVMLPAGKHTVVFTYRPYLQLFVVSLIPLVVIALWAGVRVVKRVKRPQTIDRRSET